MADLPRYMSPPQVAEILAVDCAKVRTWCASGELRAVNVATRSVGRPRWRISPEALADFEAARAAPPRQRAARKQRRDPAVIEFF